MNRTLMGYVAAFLSIAIASIWFIGSIGSTNSPIMSGVEPVGISLSNEISETLPRGELLAQGDTLVPFGETCIIPPGTRIIFPQGSKLTVDGALFIQGTKDFPVILTGEAWGGLVISSSGEVNLSHAVIANSESCIVSSGALVVDGLTGVGGGVDGIIVGHGGSFDLRHVELKGWEHSALTILGGEGAVSKSRFVGNKIGVFYSGGELNLTNNNIYENDVNVEASSSLSLHNNYFGSPNPSQARVSDNVILENVLNVPHPIGGPMVRGKEQ